MNKKNILVSGVTGIVGYGCSRSLKETNQYNIIGTSVYTNIIAHKFCDIFEKAPYTNEKGYMGWLLEVIKKHEIHLLIPGIEIDMFMWNTHRDEIEKSGAILLLNNKELIDLCEDKWVFYQKLRESNQDVCIPSFLSMDYEEAITKLGSPFLIKPRQGYGGRGIVRISSEEEYQFYMRRNSDIYMIQPIIQGEEYTIGAFFNNNSELCSYICMKRSLNFAGYTDVVEVIQLKEILSVLQELAAVFKPIGITNFQFIKSKEGYRLLEINPRVSSSTSLRTRFNYNECFFGARYCLEGKEPVQPHVRSGKANRYVEDLVEYDRYDI